MDKDPKLAQLFAMTALERAPLAVCVINEEGRFLFTNSANERLTGYPAAHLRGIHFQELVFPDDHPVADHAFAQLVAHGTVKTEVRLLGRDRTTTEIIVEASRLAEDRYCCFLTDIAALKRTEAELRRSESTLKAVIHNSAELAMILDPDGLATYLGPQCEEVLGHPPEKFLGRGVPDIIHPEDRAMVQAAWRQVFQDHHELRNLEYRIVDQAGHTRWLSHSTRTIVQGGVPQAVHNSIRDITAQRESLANLAAVKTFNETILNTSPDLIYIYDVVAKRNVYSNERINDVLGYTTQEVRAMGEDLIATLMHPEDLAVYLGHTLARYATARDREVIQHRYRMRHKSGSWRWLRSKELIFQRNPDGSPRQIFGLVADITDQHDAEIELEARRAALATSEAKYRLLFANLQPAFALHQIVEDDRGQAIDYVFLEANPAFGAMTGLDVRAIIGRPVTQVIPGIEKDPAGWITRYGQVAKDGQTLSFEQYAEPLDKWFQVLAYRPAPGQFATLFQDVTERKILEQRLHQSEKMQAIGQLAGGIAHDFNNQLAGIVGNADLLRQDLADNRELAFLVDNILLASKRAADLTGQLLAFARKGKYLVVPVDLHKLIVEVASLLTHTLDRRITIRQLLEAAHPHAQGDPSQLQNVLMNLALNARDAMPTGGEIVFSTAMAQVDAAACARNLFEIVPGRYLRVTVTDTGCGMDEATRDRMFEPFFTTKEPGKGTGMGLAAVYGTIKNHGGGLRVETGLGQGTRVDLFLPATPETPDEDRTPTPLPTTPVGARVLVVDDESVVLDMCVAMLTKLGCRPLACAGGAQAIALYEQRPQDIDLIILDLVMPEPDGVATFRRLKAINPAARIILCSGFSMEGEAQAILDQGVSAFVRKPFRYAELAQVIHDALAGAPRRPPA